jgi:YidC/Oxa1 family membrane protein insertase
MDDNNRNTILAIALSILVLIGWNYLYIAPRVEEERRISEIAQQREAAQQAGKQNEDAATVPQSQGSQTPANQDAPSEQETAQTQAPRIEISSELVSGSINLRGARFDELKLNQYHETIDDSSPLIELLHPTGTKNAYFAEFGYTKNADLGELPGPGTVWNASDTTLSGNGSVTLDWTNENGIRFERMIALDENYMFTITDSIANTTSDEIQITPYGRIVRFGTPETENIFVLHEGLIGVFGEEGLQEVDYSDVEEARQIDNPRVDAGWIGITDKYWATALIPTTSFKPRFAYFDKGAAQYQSDFIGEVVSIAPSGNAEITQRFFAGAKKSALFDKYEEELGILKFELMIDWGWFHFITKPLFWLLNWLFGIFGNFGVAILCATVIIKAIFLPLANMSYASMAKMKKVQPEMLQIRERFGDDRMKQQQEMMELYKREKINPAAGCWPMLIQIPVFFALYKVLYVTIEMRQAPFFGWIQDLAAPDPSSIWNLFGLLPWEPATILPAIMLLGIWPIIMGVTMFVQMQMNPAPPDPTQAMIFKWMPVVFTFMLATFPAGLVIYWAWNNTLSIIQQGLIMKRHGTKIELVDNLKGMFTRKSKET